MNKEITNLLTQLFTILIISVSFSGCSTSAAGTRTSEKTEDNKNQGLSQNKTVNGKKAKPVSANTVLNQNKQILWDFRKPDTSDSPEISKAETRAVVKYLFGEQASQDLEITSRVSGSFTKPNAQETLYYLSGCEDENDKGHFKVNCQSNLFSPTGWIAIYDGTTPVMKIKEDLGDGGIVKVTDVNGDGINEILSFSNYSAYELQNTSASFGQISGGKYQDIKSFGGYARRCFDESGNEFDVASSISYLPTADDKMPIFSMEYFQSGCKDDSSWKRIAKKQFDAFFDL